MNMKNITLRTIGLFTLSVLIVLSFSSCKKKSLDEDEFGIEGSFQMKVNGTEWKANSAFVSTGSSDGSEYVVAFTGIRGDDDDSSAESLNIWMAFSADKFDNPKGTYDVYTIDSDEDIENRMIAIFIKPDGSNPSINYTVSESAQSYGKVTITDFKIGEGKQIGDDFYGKIYTQISGTFEMNLNRLNSDGTGFGSEMIRLSEGKFNVRHFGNL